MRRSLLSLVLLLLTTAPASAQLAGNDVAPGDACSLAGSTVISADADGDGGGVTLICDGSNWQVEANDIQDGFRRIAVDADPCTVVGQLAQSSSGHLLVCKNAGDITDESCAGSEAAAISINDDGALHFCIN